MSNLRPPISTVFFFNDTATTEIYTLSLHDALPIFFRPLVSLPHLTPTNQAQSHRTLSAQLSAARSPLTPWLGRRAPPAGSLRSSPAPCGSGTRRSRRSRTPRRASAPRPDSGDRWPRLGPCTAAHSNTSQSPLSSRLSCLSGPVWAARHPYSPRTYEIRSCR